jgi:hypothetical protein
MAGEDKKELTGSPNASPVLPFVELQEPEEGIIDIYSNHILINWGPYDARIRFGHVFQLPDQTPEDPLKQRTIAEEEVAVTLAWPEVKFLRDLLIELVSRYEAVNGELKVPISP